MKYKESVIYHKLVYNLGSKILQAKTSICQNEIMVRTEHRLLFW